jgi:ATP-binding cassette subfamily F protein 3
MLKVIDLSFSFTDKPLYEKVNFVVGKGQKVGLVGPNGSGKSTLFNVLMGKEDGYKGKFQVNGNIVLVPQEVKYDPDMESSLTVKDYADPNAIHFDYELEQLFYGLQLDVKLSDNPNNLSGGQKTKLALARALLAKPNILLLDEPTNFMDASGKKWVMDFLTNYQGVVIVVSHDLKLLDRAIDKVLAINPATRTIDEYKGNYSAYLRLSKEKERLMARQILIKQKHIKQMEEGLRKMARFSSKKGVRKKTMQRRKVEKEKLELPDLPKEVRIIKIKLPEPAKVGELPIRALNISKSFDDLEVLRNINFTIVRGERVAFIGPNGSGKSTFVKILMGIENADSGEVIGSPQLKVGYYSQEFETFDFQKNVLETFTERTKKDDDFARAFLGRYMFLGDKVFQRIETLSGGEKTRLSIAILTGCDNNLLILDEPTTYLDVMSQKVILEALKDYKGSMILVSHTAEFVRELCPHKALLFPEEKVVFWDNELLEKVEEV